jgi:plasmid stabilization system protein ParE
VTKLDFRPRAAADLEEAAIWYESQRTGLGFQFLDETENLALRIAETPRQFPIMYRDTRRALMKRFPFAIYFRLIGERALIVAVMDLRRKASRWRRRV